MCIKDVEENLLKGVFMSDRCVWLFLAALGSRRWCKARAGGHGARPSTVSWPVITLPHSANIARAPPLRQSTCISLPHVVHELTGSSYGGNTIQNKNFQNSCLFENCEDIQLNLQINKRVLTFMNHR